MKTITELRFGLSILENSNPYWSLAIHAAKVHAAARGIQLQIERVYNPAEQVASIEQCIQQELDAIIIVPVEPQDLIGVVERAQAAGIPIIAADIPVRGCRITSLVGSDNAHGAGIAVSHLATLLNRRGPIAHLLGTPEYSMAVERAQGLHQALGRYPELTVIFEGIGNWSRASGASLMRQALAAYPALQGVIAQNDLMALGALDVIAENGLNGTIAVIGFDALPEALVALHQGRLAATVRRLPRMLGNTLIDTAVRATQNEPVPASLILDDMSLITRENLLDAALESVYMLPQVVDDLMQTNAEQRRLHNERLGLERKLMETQKLESLGVLAGGIAHDFNNLLVSMLGNAGIALMELAPESPARESIMQIEIAAQRAADLTRQMLAYAGKGQFVIQRINLNTLVQEMTHLLQVSIPKTTTIRYNLGASLPAVEADATQLRQVVMNLVVNAADAIGTQNGIIAITTGTLMADRAYLTETYLEPELAPGRYVFIEVSDTGIGMDAATRSRIFEPFFTTKFTGRGLGLAAVLGIVRGHRGALKVYSEPGRGSTFKFLLPAVGLPPDAQADNGTSPSFQNSATILVIDDEVIVRTVTQRILKSYGFAVLLAGDGQEGVELLRDNPDSISCVLLDMTMPHLNGEETFRQMRRLKPDVRVILMSGYNEQEATSAFGGKGLAGFLAKPFKPAELRAKLEQVLKINS